MHTPIVAIQGIPGSFHEMAAFHFFAGRQPDILPCATFRKEFDALAEGRCDYLILAIENTLAGSILPNYALLESSGFSIVGETYLPIRHCLMALPGQELGDFQAVWSHPMALLQCEDFLLRHPHLLPVEKGDTASAAREIAQGRLRSVAAIGPAGAASRYGLEVYAEGIQTHPHNYTRFLVVAPESRDLPDANKASLVMQVPNAPGALLQVLEVFRQFGINLTKIQSLPIPGKPYAYSFHVDMEWNAAVDWHRAIAEAEAHTESLRVLGAYPGGARPEVSG